METSLTRRLAEQRSAADDRKRRAREDRDLDTLSRQARARRDDGGRLLGTVEVREGRVFVKWMDTPGAEVVPGGDGLAAPFVERAPYS